LSAESIIFTSKIVLYTKYLKGIPVLKAKVMDSALEKK
jgi:hypothetical protein